MADDAPSRPDVFLSYAREDEARARQLATALDQRGFSVFWDREVPPGQTWHSYIGEALTNARCVVVAWSSHSVASPWVLEEAGEGKDRNVLVPVLFEMVQPPFGFRAIQAANLIDWRPGRSSPAFDSLLGAVKRIVGGQAGSGTGAEAELTAPPQAAPSKPAPEVKPATPSPASSEPGAKPVRPSNGRAGGWSRPRVLAVVAGFIAIAGAGGSALVWWLTQPEPTTPSPITEAEPLTPELRPSEPLADTEASVGRVAPAPRETGERGQAMRDCPECPEMVLVPAGEFTMGSPPDAPGRDNDEGPQRKVRIAEPLWVGKYEVTFAEWDACIAAGGCTHKPDDRGWGRDNRPVINVNWNDAAEYIDWLNEMTEQTYRLLSEAEWEYVARAGSATAYWWSDDIGRNNANCNGCGSEWDGAKTAPVGSFEANDFGLHDSAGNVWEWVQDCYHDSYDGAPRDGSAWKDGDDCSRVLRGGSWSDVPRLLRSVNRGRRNPDYRFNYYGFRVARTGD